jgi:hypothetical protein
VDDLRNTDNFGGNADKDPMGVLPTAIIDYKK